jgi:hypothetical protein
MHKHRRTQSRVPSKVRHDNFNAANALESIYVDLIQIDAFAYAAREAIVELRCPSNRAERRTFDRIYTLVTKVADEARAALLHGGALVAALSAHMEARGTSADTDPPTPRT